MPRQGRAATRRKSVSTLQRTADVRGEMKPGVLEDTIGRWRNCALVGFVLIGPKPPLGAIAYRLFS